VTDTDDQKNNDISKISAPKRVRDGSDAEKPQNEKSRGAKDKKVKRAKVKDLHKVDRSPFWIAIPRVIVQSSLYIFITILCAVGLLWVKLQHGPLDLNFAKDKIEQALSNPEAGYAVSLQQAELIWTEFDKPLYIRANQVVFNHEDGTELDIESSVFGVSVLHLFKGEVRPTYVQVTGPKIQLVEQNDQLSLFWRDEQDFKLAAEEKPSMPAKARDIRKDVKLFLTALFDEKLEGVYKNLQTLERISLNNIVVLLKQEDKENQSLGTFDLNLEKSDEALSGDINIDLPEIEGQPAKITSLISYRAAEQDLTFSATVNGLQTAYLEPFLPADDIVLQQQAIVRGKILASLNDRLRLSKVQADVVMSDGRFKVPDLTSEIIEVPEVLLRASLDRSAKKITIEKLSGMVAGMPFDVIASGDFEKGKITAPFTVKIAKGSLEQIQPFIPKKEQPSTIDKWLTEKLSGGTFKDVEVSGVFNMRRDLETKERTRSVSDVKASFGFDDMTVQYSSRLAPATQASGTGTYEDRALKIVANTSRVGTITSDNVVVDISDIGIAGQAKGDVKIKAAGPLSGVFDYLSGDPINFDKKASFKAKDTKGDVAANVRVQFPLKSDLNRNDFDVTADAIVNNVLLPNVVKGLPLTANTMAVDIKNNIVSVKGKGQFAQRPIDVTYQQNIGNGGDFRSKVVASITADEGLRKAFDVDLTSILTGPVPINFNYVDQGRTAKMNINGVLGPATVFVDEFGYNKPAGVPGTISFQATVQDKKLAEINQFKVNSEGLKIDQGRILFSSNNNKVKMRRGSLPVVQLGKTNTAIDFEIMPSNVLKIIAKGAVLDGSGFFSDKKKDKEKGVDQQPKQISLVVDQLILKDGAIGKNVKGYFETDKVGTVTRAEIDILIGKSQTVLRFKPDPNTGLRDLFLEASDAGDFLRGLGLYKSVQGGVLKIYGQPLKANSDDIIGNARIDNFKAKDAPVLAQLVNALSLPGILGLLNNDGVVFSRLESKFEWRFRPQGDLIILKEGRTSGASLGLTFEGIADRASKTIDISGTAIPASELNKMIGSIPLIGQILTGGDALLAATYTIKGPTSKPQVVVNPLSVLAPGIIRKILFEESVESKVKKAE